MAESVIEILGNTTRENYNKVVLHKQMWIPVSKDLAKDNMCGYLTDQKLIGIKTGLTI